MSINRADFYQETTPQPSVDYFVISDGHGNEIPPSKIATVTVFYNEDGYTMEKTIRSLNMQQDVQQYGNDLLLVGDGLQQMTSSMAEYLNKVYIPLIIKIISIFTTDREKGSVNDKIRVV